MGPYQGPVPQLPGLGGASTSWCLLAREAGALQSQQLRSHVGLAAGTGSGHLALPTEQAGTGRLAPALLAPGHSHHCHRTQSTARGTSPEPAAVPYP